MPSVDEQSSGGRHCANQHADQSMQTDQRADRSTGRSGRTGAEAPEIRFRRTARNIESTERLVSTTRSGPVDTGPETEDGPRATGPEAESEPSAAETEDGDGGRATGPETESGLP
jgi:hypothetical protein